MQLGCPLFYNATQWISMNNEYYIETTLTGSLCHSLLDPTVSSNRHSTVVRTSTKWVETNNMFKGKHSVDCRNRGTVQPTWTPRKPHTQPRHCCHHKLDGQDDSLFLGDQKGVSSLGISCSLGVKWNHFLTSLALQALVPGASVWCHCSCRSLRTQRGSFRSWHKHVHSNILPSADFSLGWREDKKSNIQTRTINCIRFVADFASVTNDAMTDQFVCIHSFIIFYSLDFRRTTSFTIATIYVYIYIYIHIVVCFRKVAT